MQLFITKFENKWNQIKISNKEILDQIRKVLRMKIWDTIFVQNDNIRHKIQINSRDNENIIGTIVETIEWQPKKTTYSLAIAMPNKRDKIELIVQKLSEIWVKEIYFRPSERSIIRQRNEKKLERINKIAKEAVEQSWWRFLPKINFENDISNTIKWKNIIVFDKKEQSTKNGIVNNTNGILWIVWPEWWLTDNDYKIFWNEIKTVSLWDTVLRTETASIVAARILQNHYFSN